MRAVHILWWGKPYPKQYQAYLDKWAVVDPQLKVILWTDVMLLEVMSREYPQFVQFYKGLDDGGRSGFLEVTDFGRLMVLHHAGGVYADTDIEPMRSVLPLLEEAERKGEFVLGWEPREHAKIYDERPICNCFMISPKGHEYPLAMMNWIVEHYDASRGAVKNTGPVAMKCMYDSTGLRATESDGRRPAGIDPYRKVRIVENDMFMPVTAGYNARSQTVPGYNDAEGVWHPPRVIPSVANGSDLSTAYTIHHWKFHPMGAAYHSHKEKIAPAVLVVGMFGLFMGLALSR